MNNNKQFFMCSCQNDINIRTTHPFAFMPLNFVNHKPTNVNLKNKIYQPHPLSCLVHPNFQTATGSLLFLMSYYRYTILSILPSKIDRSKSCNYEILLLVIIIVVILLLI